MPKLREQEFILELRESQDAMRKLKAELVGEKVKNLELNRELEALKKKSEAKSEQKTSVSGKSEAEPLAPLRPPSMVPRRISMRREEAATKSDIALVDSCSSDESGGKYASAR